METLDLKPNYSELGRVYGIDRRTVKKRYLGIENNCYKVRTSILDQYIDIIKDKCNIPGVRIKSVYMYIKLNINSSIGTYSNFNKYI